MTIAEQLRATTRPLTVAQAAEKLGLHPQTLYKWTRTGKIPFMRIGGALRFDPQVLVRWIEDRTID
jgi:excisionase family DNA binding protein